MGNLAVAFGISIFATVALYPALGQAVLRHRGEFQFNTGLVRSLVATLLAGTLALALLIGLDAWLLGLAGRFLPSAAWTAWIIVLAPLTVAEQYALGLCSVAGILDRYSVAMLVSRLLLIAGTAVAVIVRAPPLTLLALTATMALLLLGWIVGAARSRGRPVPGPSPPGLLKDGLAAAPNSWGWFLIAQGSVLVVQANLGAREAGLFTVAYLLLNLPVLALQGISMAWASRASRQGPGGEWRRTRRFIAPLAALHLLAIVALALGGTAMWGRFFGPELEPSFGMLLKMAIGAPGFALAYLFLPQWTARGWFLRLSGVYIAIASLFLATLYWATLNHGVGTAALCVAGLGIVLAFANLWAAWHWDREPRKVPA